MEKIKEPPLFARIKKKIKFLHATYEIHKTFHNEVQVNKINKSHSMILISWKTSMPLLHNCVWFLAAVAHNASEKTERISPSH